MRADFYYDYINFEYGGQIYQMNGITTPSGGIFAPYGNATGTSTGGKIDCGAVNQIVALENGPSKYTAWHWGANYYFGGHC